MMVEQFDFDVALSFATENQSLVNTVYHYLKAEGFKVFFAASQEGQAIISGKNQREVFYQIFGWRARYAALFVSKDYIRKTVPMEEARISLTRRAENGSVVPIYLDDASLPHDLLDPTQTNYYRSQNAVEIAAHLAAKLKETPSTMEIPSAESALPVCGTMNISENTAKQQIMIQTMNGSLNL